MGDSIVVTPFFRQQGTAGRALLAGGAGPAARFVGRVAPDVVGDVVGDRVLG